MTESSDYSLVDAAELGALLVALHGADESRDEVEVTYRVWRHRERLHAAFIADAEDQKRRGASWKGSFSRRAVTASSTPNCRSTSTSRSLKRSSEPRSRY